MVDEVELVTNEESVEMARRLLGKKASCAEFPAVPLLQPQYASRNGRRWKARRWSSFFRTPANAT